MHVHFTPHLTTQDWPELALHVARLSVAAHSEPMTNVTGEPRLCNGSVLLHNQGCSAKLDVAT